MGRDIGAALVVHESLTLADVGPVRCGRGTAAYCSLRFGCLLRRCVSWLRELVVKSTTPNEVGKVVHYAATARGTVCLTGAARGHVTGSIALHFDGLTLLRSRHPMLVDMSDPLQLLKRPVHWHATTRSRGAPLVPLVRRSRDLRERRVGHGPICIAAARGHLSRQ